MTCYKCSKIPTLSWHEIISKYDGDFDLISGRYVVDAKSIMGIFSLDLSKPIQLSLPSTTPELMEELKPYII